MSQFYKYPLKINLKNRLAHKLRHAWFPRNTGLIVKNSAININADGAAGTSVVQGVGTGGNSFNFTGTTLDGNNDITVGNATGSGGPLSAGNFSFATKLRFSDVTGAVQGIYGGDTAGGDLVLELFTDSKIYLVKSFAFAVNDTTVLSTNTDYSIVVTHDGSTAKFYINGQLSSSIADAVIPTANINAQFRLGKANGTTRIINGKMYYFIVYDRAITPAEVHQLHINSRQLFSYKRSSFQSAFGGGAGGGGGGGGASYNNFRRRRRI